MRLFTTVQRIIKKINNASYAVSFKHKKTKRAWDKYQVNVTRLP